jgi:hypothetical protein
LELSGIGDPEVLSKIGVPVKVALPAVGANVQEHVYVALSYGPLSVIIAHVEHADRPSEELKEPEKWNTYDPLRNPAIAAEQFQLQYVSSLFPPHLIIINRYSSERGTGLFTLGFIGMAFAPFELSSSRSAELHAAFAKRVEENKDSYPPGLYQQYQQQLHLLEQGHPDVEVANLTGFIGSPSTFPISCVRGIAEADTWRRCRPAGARKEIYVVVRGDQPSVLARDYCPSAFTPY